MDMTELCKLNSQIERVYVRHEGVKSFSLEEAVTRQRWSWAEVESASCCADKAGMSFCGWLLLEPVLLSSGRDTTGLGQWHAGPRVLAFLGLRQGWVHWGCWGRGNAAGREVLKGLTPALDAAPNKPPKCTALFSRSSSNHYIQTSSAKRVTIKPRGCIFGKLRPETHVL